MLGYIILGLLMDRAMTGYDLKTFFSRSIGFFWTAELSQIYRELSSLEKKGYVKYVIDVQEGRPDKKIYSVTGEGEMIFIEWLKDFPQKLTKGTRNEFLVRLFFGSRIPGEDIIFQLKRYIMEREEELKCYRAIEEKLGNLIKEGICCRENFYQRLTVERGIHFIEAELKWARECIEEIKFFEREFKD